MLFRRNVALSKKNVGEETEVFIVFLQAYSYKIAFCDQDRYHLIPVLELSGFG